MAKFTFDIESTNLLNNDTIDYTASPYKLKSVFGIHCVVFENNETGEIVAFYDGDTYIFDGRKYEETFDKRTYILEDYVPLHYRHLPMSELKPFIEKEVNSVLGHNIINFDLLACKLYFDIDYSIKYNTWNGKKVEIIDTMILSKVLNPDRFGGHSLDELSSKTGTRKIAFRKSIPANERFKDFAADMLYYCIYDVKSNTQVYNMLVEEWGNWAWTEPFKLEQRVADIITRQEHRGFAFNMEQAEYNIKDLDNKMEERRQLVEPILPKKQATKTYLNKFIPPSNQLKKDLTPNAHITKFATKIGATITESVEGYYFNYEGKQMLLPIPSEPLCDQFVPATLNDTTHIKEWLVGLGWQPLEYKDKDLMTKSGTKIKRTPEELDKAIKSYVEQTLNSNFRDDRCEHLSAKPHNLEKILRERSKKGKSLKVLTNPSFTVGQEKEMCPNLMRLKDKFPHAQQIVEYLTYRHRRNSILGGGAEWDEDDEPEKGFLSSVREDGRIATPAATCDCATSRMKHKSVANIPRVSSLYGQEMRSLFGVDAGYFQIGYDFDSLEARIEGHYSWRYESDPHEYCHSLLLDKPLDVHTKMSEKISAIIGRKFERSPAKSVKYGCVPVDNTEVLTKEGWKFRWELKVGDEVLSFNKEGSYYEYTPITKFWDYPKANVVNMFNKWFNVEVTEDHYWINRQRSNSRKKGRAYSVGRTSTIELNTESNIIAAARSNVESTLTIEEGRFLGWLLSDGYFKWSGSCRNKVMGISVSLDQDKKKYVDEMRKAVSDLFEYKEYVNGTMHKIQPNKVQFRAFLSKCGVSVGIDKHEFNWAGLIANQKAKVLDAFLEAFWLADGHTRGSAKVIRQKQGNISDAVALAINMTGHVVYASIQSDGMLTMSMSNGDSISGQRLRVTESRITDVFCISTKNESFVMRQNGFITLTGNCTYGAQAPKVAKTIGSDLKTGELIFNAFWEAAKPLALLKERLNAYWEKTGKRFILGIDGRKVPTRSAHAILNSLFQSGGVICAKRAMVIHDDLLEEHQLNVDFFKDDWKNKSFCQQLIAYHDEAQLEVTKDLVEFKWYKPEDLGWQKFEDEKHQEAENKRCKKIVEQYRLDTEKETGKMWSNVHESPKGGYFFAYSLPGELASKAVKMAGEYYNLNVDLTAGYDIGRNWAECH